MLDVASNMMAVEEHVLWMAQNEARACTRIVQCVERIADLALNANTTGISKVVLQHISSNLSLFYFYYFSNRIKSCACMLSERCLQIYFCLSCVIRILYFLL